jgi:hypothetical protein
MSARLPRVFAIDLRSLVLFRIALGLLLVAAGLLHRRGRATGTPRAR